MPSPADPAGAGSGAGTAAPRARRIGERLRKRTDATSFLLAAAAVVCALLTGALLILASHASPLGTYGDMVSAAFGSSSSFSVTIERTVPPLLTALGVAFALRAGLWNIGGDGQIYCGAMAATAVVLYCPTSPFPVTLALALVAGTAAGALWAFIPAVLRARRGISEVITSLMLVYIAEQIVAYMLTGPWSVPGATSPATNPFPGRDILPIVWPGTELNFGAILALAAVFVVWIVQSRSTLGVRLRARGGGIRAAEVMGLRVSRLTIGAMMISGALAGFAGSIDTLGYEGRLIQGFSPSWGFEAIAIALIGRLQPAGIAVAALFFGALDAGSAGLLTSGNGVSQYIAQIIEAIAVLYLLVALGAIDAIGRRRQRTRTLGDAGATASQVEPADPALPAVHT